MKCKIHPNYKGWRQPTSRKGGCTCWLIYRRNQHVKKGDTIRIQQYSKKDNGKLAKVIDTDGDYILVRRLDNRKIVIDLLRNECKKVMRR